MDEWASGREEENLCVWIGQTKDEDKIVHTM